MPRLSVKPMLEWLAELYRDAAQVDELSTDLVSMAEQASELITELGRQSNLFNLLVNSSLFHVPSIMIFLEPFPNSTINELGSPFAILSLIVILALAGLFIGVIYFGLLANKLPIGAGFKSQGWAEFLIISLRRWIQAIVLVVIVILLLLAILIPLSLGVTVLAVVSPAIASLLMALLSGLSFVAFFYLYFSTAGLILDDLSSLNAMSRSVRLVRGCFWPTFGFILLINVISRGFSLIWVPISTYVPAGTIVAIVGNAYIGTGLAMSLLVFYRTRTMLMEGEQTLEEILDKV